MLSWVKGLEFNRRQLCAVNHESRIINRKSTLNPPSIHDSRFVISCSVAIRQSQSQFQFQSLAQRGQFIASAALVHRNPGVR